MASCNKGVLPAPCLVYGKRPIFILESMVKIMVSHRGILCRKTTAEPVDGPTQCRCFFLTTNGDWITMAMTQCQQMEENMPRFMAQQYVKTLCMVSPCLRWFMVLFSTPNEFGSNRWTFKRFSEKFWSYNTLSVLNEWKKGPDWQHSFCVIFQFIFYIYMPRSNNCMHTA